MTFKEYLANRVARENPQGDFVRDARADRQLPDVATWPELHSYLRSIRAGSETIEAGRLVWQSYRQVLKPNSVTRA